jgi:phospholipid transport system transporter-binding protein
MADSGEQGTRIMIRGAMTIESARRLLDEGQRQIVSPQTEIDLTEVSAVDSSALAVIFGWMRFARAHHRQIRIAHPPAQLHSLASLYGVAELLPL